MLCAWRRQRRESDSSAAVGEEMFAAGMIFGIFVGILVGILSVKVSDLPAGVDRRWQCTPAYVNLKGDGNGINVGKACRTVDK